MQKNRYKSILYFISAVILVTLVIQIYWNFKNYQASKQQLVNEVQISLDNAVDQYYEELAKNQTFGFISNPKNSNYFSSKQLDKILKQIDSTKKHFSRSDLSDSIRTSEISFYRNKNIDSTKQFIKVLQISDSIKTMLNISEHDSITVSTNTNPFETLTSKIVISISQDEVNLNKIDSLLKVELVRKKVSADYTLKYTNQLEQLHNNRCDTLTVDKNQLYTQSKSSYLPPNSSLKLFFTNTTIAILKKNLLGILLSFILMTAVIGCLLYLLQIINHQKHLAALKNDLISNITHEFKTPIATISAALEGIQNFNQENDQKKTKKYIEMSSGQLNKLNTMVEKILETATLDSDELQLNLEETNLIKLIHTIAEKHKVNSPEKNITFTNSHENIWRKIDVFHFENAINNIVDNAIKYGGNTVGISIINTDPHIIIEIKDNGTGLTKAHKEKIFEKFYRVPKGNTHDVKGFGIGLFYTKTIIEKHKGTIQLSLDQGLTNFKITLPNG
ncbi:sensor histidine kinase KdpD [Aquimarina sp. AU58]|uniref:sensor histidine kinase n=1 Tax=Aquimarina sp. AU58 TaxID=1874112 RepID=UPI000D6E96EB|nr:HAMP domain-containing sensor histidine kinase [Aquimarina sp. AU58]